MKTDVSDLKGNCRSVFRNAVIRGEVKVGPCSVCGSTTRIEAHHEDYTKPLDVVYYCKKHHNEYHHGKTDKKYVYNNEIVKLRIDCDIMDKIRIVCDRECRKYTDQINFILKQWVNEIK